MFSGIHYIQILYQWLVSMLCIDNNKLFFCLSLTLFTPGLGGGRMFPHRLELLITFLNIYLKFIWEQFGMTCHCSHNLVLPWQPYFDRHVFPNLEFHLKKLSCNNVYLFRPLPYLKRPKKPGVNRVKCSEVAFQDLFHSFYITYKVINMSKPDSKKFWLFHFYTREIDPDAIFLYIKINIINGKLKFRNVFSKFVTVLSKLFILSVVRPKKIV